MAAFDKIDSGFDGLDRTLDWIRLGDNVVWQVSSVDDYRQMVLPFARRAIADGRDLHYIRFAPHPPLLESQPNLSIHELDPGEGFETFTGEVHRIVADAGIDAFYVFDCLSELQTAWAADLMMGNFFMVTCPFLFELDTVAWFCLLRNRHSFDTIARIRETTQLLIDLYHDDDCLYVHPLKVWQRFSPTMFFPASAESFGARAHREHYRRRFGQPFLSAGRNRVESRWRAKSGQLGTFLHRGARDTK